MKVKIEKQNLQRIINIFTILKECYSNIVIQRNNILQYSDTRDVVVHCDLGNLIDCFDNSHIHFNNLKEKIDALKTMTDCDDSVEITTDSNNYIFNDGVSSIYFPIPNPEFITETNPLLSYSDFNNIITNSEEINRITVNKSFKQKIDKINRIIKSTQLEVLGCDEKIQYSLYSPEMQLF